MTRPTLAIAVALLLAAPVTAGPRDELLRVTPSDTALVIVVQNARDHVRSLIESPFAAWFPDTEIGKKILGSAEFKQLQDAAGSIFTGLGTTPKEVLDDILGDAIAFAYSPAPPGRPSEERAIILIRPGKPDSLAKLVARLDDLQIKSGELKAVVRRAHAEAAYFERQRAGGGASQFYCTRGDVFAFSESETEIKAFIDRAKNEPAVADKSPDLVERMKKLQVADAVAVILVNPRPLDAEVKAKVAAANGDTKRLLERFEELWTGVDSAAVYITLGTELEVGLSVRFLPEKLPPDLKKWLVGPHEAGTAAYMIPKDALVGIAGHFRAAELIDLVATLAPVPAGKPGVKEFITDKLGPVVGKDNLPLVLDSLGPNWAVWAEPPVKDSFLPTLVAAVEISGQGAARVKAEKSITQAVEFAFTMARIAYNAGHMDQIEVKEEKDADSGVTITSLVNEKGFPPGFRPSFAITRGYLVLATSPDAIKRFRPPVLDGPILQGYTTLAKLSGTGCRDYLRTHGPKLAKFLADVGMGEEKTLKGHIENLAAVMELVDSADIIRRDIDNGLKLSARIKLAKPLKK